MAKLFTNADLDSMEVVDLKAQRADFDAKCEKLEQDASQLNINDALFSMIKGLDLSNEKYYSIGLDGKLSEIAEGYEGLAVGITFVPEIYIGYVKNGQPNGIGKTYKIDGDLSNVNSASALQVVSYGNFVNGLLDGFSVNVVETGALNIIATGNQNQNGLEGYCVVEIVNSNNGETTMNQAGIINNGVLEQGSLILSSGATKIFQTGVFDIQNNQLKDGKLYVNENGNWKMIAEVKNGQSVNLAGSAA